MLAVVVNVGGASPHARSTQRAAAMSVWARRAIEGRKPQLVFAQEVPSDDWLEIWASSGYEVVITTPRFRVCSALLVDKALKPTPFTAAELPTLAYRTSPPLGASYHS